LEIGGDWFEVITEPPGRVSVVVGDVVGHSLPAAAAMGQLAAAARALACTGQNPAHLIASLDLVAERTPDAVMTSLACATLHTDDGCLRYSCAGHPPPCLRRPDGKAVLLEGGRRAPLAVRTSEEPVEDSIILPPGSAVLFYTDGLVERRTIPLDQRFDELLAVMEAVDPHDPEAACDLLVGTLIGDEQHEDDVAMVLLTIDR
jgi:serine phosphatase RsbU (regulator of sigma subunit)